MTREREEEIMGWIIVMMVLLAVIAVANATPTPEVKSYTCTESVVVQ